MSDGWVRAVLLVKLVECGCTYTEAVEIFEEWLHEKETGDYSGSL